ncbi:hypothetical protein BYT27DRAFT_7189949 [Phlegmacium glaucopus]|nr:hypothetical protein BYT27DRAFT_7189949 [Phlegmacium glaucopus]
MRNPPQPLQSTLTNVPSTLSSQPLSTLLRSSSHVERKLGDSELSYFLPSRESGVNDMYLHLGFRAPSHLIGSSRISLVWAIMRVRHPLLASKVKMNSYDDVRFVYDTPLSPEAAWLEASRNVEYRSQSKDALIDAYLNGSRTLSNDRLSYLIINSDCTNKNIPTDYSQDLAKDCDLMICATHFLGDGMALHQFANDFFVLLVSCVDEGALLERLTAEWSEKCTDAFAKLPTLPSAMEDRLPPAPAGRLRQIASVVDFNVNQRKVIGGHTFPRQSKSPRKTIVPTISFDREKTKAILKNCKAHGVSISSTLFAICNIAWARCTQNWTLPMMMYSALNMRPYLMADKRLNDSYWFIAIGYFNVILPTFLPQSGGITGTFWHRARSAKSQSIKAAKTPMAISRCREMARERGARARVWAQEDDYKLAGIFKKPMMTAVDNQVKEKVPSNALMGLSLLGNLDATYKHATFPEIQLHTLTTGSRQRSGGMLLFGYTFVEKLWVSFGYDKNSYQEDVVNTFWTRVTEAIDEFLLT